MAERRRKQDPKVEALRKRGTLHPHPQDVDDPDFAVGGFFDPRDLVQVKYEMLRRVRAEGASVTGAALRFGLSRPTYYGARADYEREGVAGLLPKKRGPQGPHKLTDEVMAFVRGELAEDESLGGEELARRIQARFGLGVHPRTVERGLARRKKNNA